jgi:hypothetical protein
MERMDGSTANENVNRIMPSLHREERSACLSRHRSTGVAGIGEQAALVRPAGMAAAIAHAVRLPFAADVDMTAP